MTKGYASLNALTDLVGTDCKRQCVVRPLVMHSGRLAKLLEELASKLVPAEIEHWCGHYTYDDPTDPGAVHRFHGAKCTAPWRGKRGRSNRHGDETVVLGGTRISWHAGYNDDYGSGTAVDQYSYVLYVPALGRGKVVLVPVVLQHITDKDQWRGIRTASWSFFVRGAGSVYIEGDGDRSDRKMRLMERLLLGAISSLPRLTPATIRARVPYRFRTGRVRAQYVYGKEISKKDATNLWMAYLRNRKERPVSPPVSFNEYARVLAVCIAAVKRLDKTSDETTAEALKYDMHDLMRTLSSLDDPSEFTEAVHSNKWQGSHILEHFGITVIPPKPASEWEGKPHFYVSASDDRAVRVARTLIANKVSFKMDRLKRQLDLMVGTLWVDVNKWSDDVACDSPKDEFFGHVVWDTLPGMKLRVVS